MRQGDLIWDKIKCSGATPCHAVVNLLGPLEVLLPEPQVSLKHALA